MVIVTLFLVGRFALAGRSDIEALAHVMRPAIAILGLAAAEPALADACQDRTLHLVVGYSLGGTGAIVASAVAGPLSRQLDQKVIVDHRPGASGGIAAQEGRPSFPGRLARR